MTDRYEPTPVDEIFYWEEIDRLTGAFDYGGSAERFSVFFERIVKPRKWTHNEITYAVDMVIIKHTEMPPIVKLANYYVKEAFYRGTWVEETDTFEQVLHVDTRVVPKEDHEDFEKYGRIEWGRWW